MMLSDRAKEKLLYFMVGGRRGPSQSRRYKIVDSKRIPKTKELIEQMEEYKKRTGNATAGKIRCYI